MFLAFLAFKGAQVIWPLGFSWFVNYKAFLGRCLCCWNINYLNFLGRYALFTFLCACWAYAQVPYAYTQCMNRFPYAYTLLISTGARIWIQQQWIKQNLQINLIFSLSKTLFYTYVGEHYYLSSTKSIFIMYNFNVWWCRSLTKIRIPHWFDSQDPDPNWGKKLDLDPHWSQFGSTTRADSSKWLAKLSTRVRNTTIN